MREISNKTRPDTRSDSDSKSSGTGKYDERIANIRAANTKIRLLDVLRHYGLKIEKNHQRPTWSNNIICPMPTHKKANERSPSFGYCFVRDYCHCLGCGFTGRAVEFISAYERISRTEVANRILEKYGNDVSEDDFKDYDEDLMPILLSGSLVIQEAIQNNKDNPKLLEYIEKLVWWLDFYMTIKLPQKAVTAEELRYRVERVKEFISNEVSNSR